MLDLLRARLAQGRQTSGFPADPGPLPERFRGRPVLVRDDANGAIALPADPTTAFVQRDAHQLPVLDVGACQFSPEEAINVPGCQVRYTSDYRMATTSRHALVTPSGELELAHALNAKMLHLFGRSLRLRSVAAGSCSGCEAELVALSNVVFDLARFGVQFVASPRHADGLVITGVVNANMRDALERTWAAVGEPRVVIAVGACAASGGPFRGSSEVVGIPENIPVDLWVPGCPPHPLTLLDGLLRWLGRLEEGERR